MKQLMTIPSEFYQNRKLIWTLAKNDFRTKYAGSYLGIIWAFVQPVVTVIWRGTTGSTKGGSICIMAGLWPGAVVFLSGSSGTEYQCVDRI